MTVRKEGEQCDNKRGRGKKQGVKFSCQEICRERQDSIIRASSSEEKGGKGPQHRGPEQGRGGGAKLLGQD